MNDRLSHTSLLKEKCHNDMNIIHTYIHMDTHQENRLKDEWTWIDNEETWDRGDN